MGKTQELGRRIEICSSDRHCRNISVALYRQEATGTPRFLVHTYSRVDGAPERTSFLRQSLITMLGMEPDVDDANWLRFACGATHERALRRAFLDLCRLPSDARLEPKELTAFDKKADCQLRVVSHGDGCYAISADVDTDSSVRRAAAVARGFEKLCDLPPSTDAGRFRFDCGAEHNAIAGMLLSRAQNVRASMREEEQSANKGVLAPPSQQ